MGREAVTELYRGYGETIVLHGAGDLAVHRDREASVVVLEYAVHGRAVSTGHAYDNHFVSVITIKDRKVTHWRDYVDPSPYSKPSAGRRAPAYYARFASVAG